MTTIETILSEEYINYHWGVETRGGYIFGKQAPGSPLMETRDEAEQMLKEWIEDYGRSSDPNKNIRVNPHSAKVRFIKEGDDYHQTTVIYKHGVNDGYHGSKKDDSNPRYLSSKMQVSLNEANPLYWQLVDIVDRIYPLRK